MKTALNTKEWNVIAKLLSKANNTDLYVIKGNVENELRLSENAIKEGFEQRRTK